MAKSDAKVAGDIKRAIGKLAELMTEAVQRGIEVSFNIDKVVSPVGADPSTQVSSYVVSKTSIMKAL